MRYKRKIAWFILAALAFMAIIILVTMTLWNWLIPEIFNGPQITFIQAAGLILLAKIMFGFGSSKGGWGKSYKKRSHRHHMSYEEKEMLKRRFMERCGWTPPEEKEAESEQPNEEKEDNSDQESSQTV